MTTDQILTALGLLLTGMGMLMAVTKYLMDRMDKKVNECHDRISRMREDMTHKTDFEKHVEYMERQIVSLRDDLKNSHANFTASLQTLGSQLTSRLDNIMLALGKGGKND